MRDYGIDFVALQRAAREVEDAEDKILLHSAVMGIVGEDLIVEALVESGKESERASVLVAGYVGEDAIFEPFTYGNPEEHWLLPLVLRASQLLKAEPKNLPQPMLDRICKSQTTTIAMLVVGIAEDGSETVLFARHPTLDRAGAAGMLAELIANAKRKLVAKMGGPN